MAVTKPDKNKALAALTSAALSLPGLNATAAIPSAQIEGNASYGHYQESDNRMQVDVYHADGIVPLTERIELAFSVDRDTYSGATPAFSMPATMTKQPKYKQKSDGTPSTELSYVDVIAAASGGVTAAGLTILGGLNAFQSFSDGNNATQAQITAYNDSAIEGFILERDASLTAIDDAEAAAQAPFTAQYVSDTTALANQLNTDQATLHTQYNNDKTSLETQYIEDKISLEAQYKEDKVKRNQQYDDDLGAINPDIPALNAAYRADIERLDASFAADLAKLDATYTAANADVDAAYAAQLATLDAAKAANEASYIAGNPRPPDPPSISSPAIIDFNTGMKFASYAGAANIAPIAGGACPGSGNSGCFYQNGMVVGIVQDSSNPIAHLHRAGTSPDFEVQYHADSSGIYIRSLDSKAFSLDSMDFKAPIDASSNPGSGPSDYWEILGFNSALNPGLDTGDGTNYATRVAYQQVANGFNGTLMLNSSFNNINAFWIHYHGYPQTPTDGKSFSMALDNIKVSPVVLPTTGQVAWDSDLQSHLTDYLNTIYNPQKAAVDASYDSQKTAVETTYNSQKNVLTEAYNTQEADITATYKANLAVLTAGYETETAALKAQFDADMAALSSANAAEQAALTSTFNAQEAALQASYDTQKAAINATYDSELAAVTTTYDSQIAAVSTSYDAQKAEVNANYDAQLKEQKAKSDALTRLSQIALYRAILDSQIPAGTPTVQVFQVQPQETRTSPQFSANYYFDTTTLGISGGLSDEPDFLSNFGSTNVSHEFNDKLTTVSAGYGISSNTITRNGSSAHSSHHATDPAHFPTNYAALYETSTFNSFNTGIAQVLSKNTLFQSNAIFTHQSGYLTNPYKYVYVRGEITPEEYYYLWNPPADGVDWNAVTNLEVVGLDLFRENRPEQRNIFSLSNGINHYIPALDASVHFDYRFYSDDWGINSHAFELKWFQSLPWGLTVTPGIRYYSQSQADFFAPYFLAPRADGYYSSDFRLSAFGDLSSGLTISKQFARGINLEIGAEYVTHSGSLRLGGGGVDDYANFNYYLAHANLNVDLSARPLTGGEHSGHTHHHHGAPVPAGVMYAHMMNQVNEIMVGYRYMWSGQSGSMLHDSDKVSNQTLVSNACNGLPNGCLYKPKSMNMNMHMLDLMYAPTDWLNLMLMPQLMSMDMTMSDPIRPYANTTEETELGGHGGAKHYSNDIGDTVMTALVKVVDAKGHHVHVALGVSAPTGSINARLDSTNLQDYGMQLGSGTWDFKPSVAYTGQFNDWSWGAQLSGVKRLDKNSYGYAYGDIFQATSWGSYQVFNWLSASIRGVYTAQGQISGESNQVHQITATVDYPSNYGGRFGDVGFGLNVSIPEGQFAGHNLSFEWLQPVSTDFNGYQLDRSGALAVSWSYSF